MNRGSTPDGARPGATKRRMSRNGQPTVETVRFKRQLAESDRFEGVPGKRLIDYFHGMSANYDVPLSDFDPEQ